MSQWTRSGAGEAYDSARPPWPPAAAEFLASLAPPGGWDVALDLAAGTGKLTDRVLGLARRVIAVEPSPAQLEVLRTRVPGAETLLGAAESIPLGDDTVDLLVAGNAVHWFDPEPAAAEAQRVLRAGGALVSLWWFPEWPDWFHDLWEELADYRNDVANAAVQRASSGAWKASLEARFGPLESRELGRTQMSFSHERFLRMFATIGFVAALDEPRRAEAVAVAARFLAGTEEPVPVPHRLQAAWARA